MSRIRYRKSKQQEAVYESVQRFVHPTSGARYKVLLNLKEHQWMVIDEHSELVAASGLRVHQHKIKIDVRDALAKLGVVLTVDERVKRKASVEV